MKKVVSVLMLFVMVLSLVACGQNNNSANAGTDEKVIKIGVFEPQTGENGGGGYQEVLGIRYANQIYPTIDINGETYKIELFEVDNKSDKSEAVTAAQKLVADKKVVGVLGSYGSGVSIAAGEYFKEAKIPAIGCSCTNPQVTNGNEYYFRVCFLDPFQGTVMASYAKKHGYEKVAVITQLGDDYSEGLGNFFIKACEKYGIEVVATEKFNTNEQDFKAILTNIKEKNPQFVFAPSSITTAPLILVQAKENGLNCQFAGGDTWENGTIIENAHGAAEGTVVTTFYDEKGELNEEGEKFINGGINGTEGFFKYMQKDPTQKNEKNIPAVSALGYDSYVTLYNAIKNANSIKGEDIKNALVNIDIVGVTGKITFNNDGDADKTAAYIKEIKDSKFDFKEIVDITDVQ